MRRVHQIGGLLFLLLGFYVGYLSTQLTYLTSLGPGPGFFPFWLSALLVVLSAVMFVAATRGESEPLPEGFFSDRSGYAKSGTAVLAMMLTAAFIEYLGFIVTMAVFHLLLLCVFARRRFLETLALTLLGSFGVYYLFAHLLGTPLPRGLYSF